MLCAVVAIKDIPVSARVRMERFIQPCMLLLLHEKPATVMN